MAKIGRPGAAKGKKGAVKGTGGHGRQALEGRGPTPKAEDRPYHKAYKALRGYGEPFNRIEDFKRVPGWCHYY